MSRCAAKPLEREQKKLPPSIASSSALWQTVFAMELLPLPAFPMSQQICGAFASFIHALMSPRIDLRVPSAHPEFNCAS